MVKSKNYEHFRHHVMMNNNTMNTVVQMKSYTFTPTPYLTPPKKRKLVAWEATL